jgi:ribosome-binding factor A
MGTRRIPDLSFHVDKSEKFQTRIDELLGRAKKRQKNLAPSVAPEAGGSDNAGVDASSPK